VRNANLNFRFSSQTDGRARFGLLRVGWLTILVLLASQMSLPISSAQTTLPSATHRPTIRTISTRLAGFGVPFTVDPEDQSFIEVHLYVSSDKGENWQFYDRGFPVVTRPPASAHDETFAPAIFTSR